MVFVNIKVFGSVMSGTVVLLPYIASHRACGQLRLVIGVILPPLVGLPLVNIQMMNQRNVSIERIEHTEEYIVGKASFVDHPGCEVSTSIHCLLLTVLLNDK